jgi:hypothetical protein
MTAEGYLVFKVPEYYEGAGQDSMIDAVVPGPCKSPQDLTI